MSKPKCTKWKHCFFVIITRIVFNVNFLARVLEGNCPHCTNTSWNLIFELRTRQDAFCHDTDYKLKFPRAQKIDYWYQSFYFWSQRCHALLEFGLFLKWLTKILVTYYLVHYFSTSGYISSIVLFWLVYLDNLASSSRELLVCQYVYPLIFHCYTQYHTFFKYTWNTTLYKKLSKLSLHCSAFLHFICYFFYHGYYFWAMYRIDTELIICTTKIN